MALWEDLCAQGIVKAGGAYTLPIGGPPSGGMFIVKASDVATVDGYVKRVK